MIVAAANTSDIIVLTAVLVGAVLAITGLGSLDPRVRRRLPIAALARGNALVSLGLILAGLVVVGIALGGGE